MVSSSLVKTPDQMALVEQVLNYRFSDICTSCHAIALIVLCFSFSPALPLRTFSMQRQDKTVHLG